jgi:hypothetical protein
MAAALSSEGGASGGHEKSRLMLLAAFGMGFQDFKTIAPMPPPAASDSHRTKNTGGRCGSWEISDSTGFRRTQSPFAHIGGFR